MQVRNFERYISLKIERKIMIFFSIDISFPPGKFFMVFGQLLIFFKINFFEKLVQKYHLTGFALPIAIVAKCEEIINLAQKR